MLSMRDEKVSVCFSKSVECQQNTEIACVFLHQEFWRFYTENSENWQEGVKTAHVPHYQYQRFKVYLNPYGTGTLAIHCYSYSAFIVESERHSQGN